MRTLLLSFKYAFRGLGFALRERNMRIHVVIAGYIVLLGFMLGISACEWCAVFLSCALVIGTECMNTAIEKLCDYVCDETNVLIGNIKDIAASAVLVSAITAVAVGSIVFIREGIIDELVLMQPNKRFILLSETVLFFFILFYNMFWRRDND